jgi:hypothetical protein
MHADPHTLAEIAFVTAGLSAALLWERRLAGLRRQVAARSASAAPAAFSRNGR